MQSNPGSENVYIHTPINSNSIRLFRISFDENGSIAGQIREFPNRSPGCPEYHIVSYCCGPKIYDKRIYLNGQPFYVLQNAYPFLEMICDNTEFSPDLWWWMDSICINQNDHEEHSSQVESMGQMYRQAKVTIIWLGPPSVDSDEALRFLHLLRSFYARSTPDNRVSELLEDPILTPSWKALDNLLQREWWKRMWTLQEYIVSSRGAFFCGKTSIQMSTLNYAAYSIFYCEGSDGTILSKASYSHIWNRRRLRQWYREFGEIPLVAAMAYMCDHNANDPRDRIYSLQGMIRRQDQFMAGTPDYSASIRQVYTQLVVSFVDTYQSLDIICLAHIFNHFARRSTSDLPLPSWVPDWRAQFQPDVTPLMVSQSAHSYIDNLRPLHSLDFDAAYKASGSSTPKVKFSANWREMECEGILIDVIDGLGGLNEDEGKCNGGHPFVQSTSSSNIANSTAEDIKYDVKRARQWVRAMCSCLVLGRRDKYLCYHESEDHWRHFYQYCLGATQRPADGDDPYFLDWFQLNKKLSIKGYSLETLLQKPSLPMAARTTDNLSKDHPGSFLGRLHNTTKRKRRRLVVTAAGHVGVAPCRARKGDTVCVLFGCNVPVLLTPHPIEAGAYEFLGECYVHGFMEGEIMAQLENGVRQARSFRLL